VIVNKDILPFLKFSGIIKEIIHTSCECLTVNTIVNKNAIFMNLINT
jgi:hypothetical protein